MFGQEANPPRCGSAALELVSRKRWPQEDNNDI